ncbi:hypothetical protein ACHAXA_003982 [Cyclostephanos tholiformis]|uniref:Uncharacterized protein n=1 Tax=Cyclostephanos tholiformis TaxID=382380 RepID=A0ABD3RBG3_9STRA
MTTIRRVRRVADGVGATGVASSPPTIISHTSSSSMTTPRRPDGGTTSIGGGGGGGDDAAPPPRMLRGGEGVRIDGMGMAGGGIINTMGGGSTLPPPTTSLSERLRLLNENEGMTGEGLGRNNDRQTLLRRGPMLDADHRRAATTTSSKSTSSMATTKENTTKAAHDSPFTSPSITTNDINKNNADDRSMNSGGWSWASSAMNSAALMIKGGGEQREVDDDGGVGGGERRRRTRPIVIHINAARGGMTKRVVGSTLLPFVLAGVVAYNRHRRADRRNDGRAAFVDSTFDDVGSIYSSSSSSSSKKKKKKMMPSSSSSLTMNDQYPSSLRGRDNIPSNEEEGVPLSSQPLTNNDDDILLRSSSSANSHSYPSSSSPIDYLSHLSNVSVPYDKYVETPYFWDVHFSGESIAERVFAVCHDLVQASEFGLRQHDYNEDRLETFVLDDARYVNVDTTTDEGIERASRLGLAQSRLADVVISPHFRDVSSRVFSSRHPGRMFALFRHPVDRAVSMYYYLSKASWDPMYNPALSKMTIKEYANSGYIENNWVTRFLVNKKGGKLGKEDMALAKHIINSRCLVGLYEDIDVSLARFVRYFGWGMPTNSTVVRSAADVVKCRSEIVARGDRHVAGKYADGDHRDVMTAVRPGTLAWNAIVRMNMFDMELYEYVKRAYQAQAEEIFDVVGYELPAPVVDTAAAASMIGNVARPKSMNEQSIVGTSSRPGNGMEINASDEDHVSAGGGDMDVVKTSSKVSCEDSDDEDRDAEDDEPPQSVSDTSWRIERVAKTIVSDDQLTRLRTLRKLKDAIEALLVNCTVSPQLKYPLPYDIDRINSIKDLPLVSDFVKPKQVESTSTNPGAQGKTRLPMHREADESLARLQIIFNSCGKSLFRVIGDVIETEEELRLELCRTFDCLLRGILAACNLLVQLLRIPHWGEGSKYFATGLARSALLGCRQRNTKVVIASITLFEMCVCCSVSVNTLAELASHTNHRVRLRCCEMLSSFMVYLPDKYDHHQRLLPYVLSFINDDVPRIRDAALDCIEKCGLQHEYEHPEDVIERRQFGIDGDDAIDYDRDLPMPFLIRPSLGARLFVRSNADRFFLALLGELSSWREHTRIRSAELLLILTVYCEERLTKDFSRTIASVAKAIGVEMSSRGESDTTGKLEPIRRVLRLMGKYVDPAAYLPLLCPRISGDSSSGTSDSEDGCHSEHARRNYAIVLSSLVGGSPLDRLVLHWSALAPLLSSEDCIGPFVGTQTRRHCLIALHALIVSITGEDRMLSFASRLGNVGEIGAALIEIMTNAPPGDENDAELGKRCISGLMEIKAVVEGGKYERHVNI